MSHTQAAAVATSAPRPAPARRDGRQPSRGLRGNPALTLLAVALG